MKMLEKLATLVDDPLTAAYKNCPPDFNIGKQPLYCFDSGTNCSPRDCYNCWMREYKEELNESK